MPRAVFVALVVALALAAPSQAHHGSQKKAIWGPATGEAFRTYHRLGVGIYEMSLSWSAIARTRPAEPADPNDPAYAGRPTSMRRSAGRSRYGIRMMLMLIRTRRGRTAAATRTGRRRVRRTSPTSPRRRRAAIPPSATGWSGASRRASRIHAARSRDAAGSGSPARSRRAPRHYARMLDASYAALKGVQPRNLVIGGNSTRRATSRR